MDHEHEQSRDQPQKDQPVEEQDQEEGDLDDFEVKVQKYKQIEKEITELKQDIDDRDIYLTGMTLSQKKLAQANKFPVKKVQSIYDKLNDISVN